MQYVATAAFSLEGNVKRELAALGAENPCCELGGVRFEGDWLQAFRANLWLRQADRVLLIVGEGRAESFEELFQLVRAMPWHRYLPKNASFPVSGKCARSTLMSVRDCQAITKKAIAEAMKAAYHVNWCPEDGPVYQVDVSIHENSVRLTLDTSGDALNRRGYRTWNGEAPLRETLAAALVDMSAWRPDGDWRLHDPCCGTGTLLIEAALMQADRAPGLRRAFAMEKWAHVPAETLRLARQEALDRYQPDRIRGISGSDADPQALALCKKHIAQAGLGGRITVYQKDLRELKVEGEGGLCFLCNPPYGERLGDRRQCEGLYREMHALQLRHPGSRMNVICAHTGFERCFGQRALRRRRLYNGRLECEFYSF